MLFDLYHNFQCIFQARLSDKTLYNYYYYFSASASFDSSPSAKRRWCQSCVAGSRREQTVPNHGRSAT